MSAEAAARQARFLTGSTMRHVINMTITGAFGLMAMFMVDLADLYFLSLLNQTEVTAAIGYAGTITFVNLSLAIGFGIASAALVARNIGAGDRERARQFAASNLLVALIGSFVLTVVIAASAPWMLRLLGANDEALALATRFIWTLTPGFVLLTGAISCSFSLRGIGDARRAMYITLSTAIVTAILDPLFIFGLNMGMQGAAVANVCAYAIAFAIGHHGLARVHDFLPPLRFAAIPRDWRAIQAIAIPAILTQLATPFANAYVTRAVSPFGDEAVAASAIIGRLIPVAFGVIFALSGSVGPIIGQNFGARNFARVRQALSDALIFAAVYTLATSLLIFIFRNQISDVFNAAGRTHELVVFFCTWIGVSWAFAGAQFVSNAACNNLGYPNLSTWFNWGKATVGTIPFAWAGAKLAGPEGILAGVAIGAVIFGLVSVAAAYRIISRLEAKPG
jgi:putative MATE family efflux protein